MTDVARAAEAIRAGELVVLPTDTVYGLACAASLEGSARSLYALKGRPGIQPTAILAAGADELLHAVPELRGRVEEIVHALLPGPYTLVLPNPARRFPWLNAERPDAIGVRVPLLPALTQAVLATVGVVAATSANLAGGADPRRLADVPGEILEGIAVALDAGDLPGVPSTVIDLTGPEPVILREGAVPSAEAMASATGQPRHVPPHTDTVS